MALINDLRPDLPPVASVEILNPVISASELQLTVIELKKGGRLGQLQGPASDWIRFFEHWKEETVMGDVTHEPVKKAMGSIRQLSADEEAQRLAEAREWGRINWNLSVGAARREGLKQGLEQGRLQALRDTLARQLARRFGELPVWVVERLDVASAKELEASAEAILEAGNLEELFGRPG